METILTLALLVLPYAMMLWQERRHDQQFRKLIELIDWQFDWIKKRVDEVRGEGEEWRR